MDRVLHGAVLFRDSGEVAYQVLVRHRLTEIEPGLFLTQDGETLDLRGSAPTWRNVDSFP